MNPEAEKIVRGVIRSAGASKLTLLAGAARQAQAAEKKPRAVRPGSAQSKAMEHPMVQQAQRLFDAEIQTVIDLSGKD
jgi:DNA polymerase III subunit gamma/tau